MPCKDYYSAIISDEKKVKFTEKNQDIKLSDYHAPLYRHAEKPARKFADT